MRYLATTIAAIIPLIAWLLFALVQIWSDGSSMARSMWGLVFWIGSPVALLIGIFAGFLCWYQLKG